MRYPFVLLDAGGTILSPRASYGAVYARVFSTFGVTASEASFEAAILASWRDLDRAIPPGADRYGFFPDGEEGYWRRFVAGVTSRVPGSEAVDALGPLRDAFLDAAAWEVPDEVLPTLDVLRRAGVRLAVVSNWDSRLPRLLERLDLASRFDAVVVSCFEGIEKPDPEIFRRALKRLGARPAEALHVGDVAELDGDGARAAGIDAVLVDRRGRLAPGPGVLRDLSRLPALAAGGS
ncbi:MAG TPA: HAD-IA family hydrolase [Candidatus Polarisedimenticolaceae bacterium]